MENKFEIIQENENKKIFYLKKTVDWLINNYDIKVFDPIKFQGYQREINLNYCRKIVKYISDNEFYFPSAITCSIDNENELTKEDAKYEIVDGQHRIRAFELIKNSDIQKFNQIKKYEIPIIILCGFSEIDKIETFITINKTQKKVDTSLALILKNKIQNSDSNNLNIENKNKLISEYICVEIAKKYSDQNDDHIYENVDEIWENRICFNKSPSKKGYEFISLHSFVKSTRLFVQKLIEKGIVSCDWTSNEKINEIVSNVMNIHKKIWKIIKNKWLDLFNKNDSYRKIIQGTIGSSAINRVLIEIMIKKDVKNESELFNEFTKIINSSRIDSKKWMPGDYFSKFSSESGFRSIANEIMNQ